MRSDSRIQRECAHTRPVAQLRTRRNHAAFRNVQKSSNVPTVLRIKTSRKKIAVAALVGPVRAQRKLSQRGEIFFIFMLIK